MTEPDTPDTLAAELLERWALRPDGPAIPGTAALVLPVRTAEGQPAVLKVGRSEPDSEHAHLVLRRWGGDGAVRLLSADPHRNALLLERLHQTSLGGSSTHLTTDVVAGLYRRLHVAPLPQLTSLTTHLERWMQDFGALPGSAPIPHRQVAQALSLARDLAAPAEAARVLHGDLHPGNVLGADRAPWLAIAPKPVNGDPHFELAPVLLYGWADLADDIRGGVQRRFYSLVDAAGFDEDRARAWVIVRVVHEAVRELRRDADRERLTRYVTLAKAVQE